VKLWLNMVVIAVILPSSTAVANGRQAVCLAPCRDHKQLAVALQMQRLSSMHYHASFYPLWSGKGAAHDQIGQESLINSRYASTRRLGAGSGL